jgi:transcriptional regulator with XRE-family HTH domain
MTVVGSGRRYPTHTRLGALMADRGLRMYEVAAQARMDPRAMSDYLAGRKPIPPHRIARLSAVLDVDAEEIVGLVDSGTVTNTADQPELKDITP